MKAELEAQLHWLLISELYGIAESETKYIVVIT
jgi:hypothetical protein